MMLVLDLSSAGVTYSPALDWNFTSTVQPQLSDMVIAHPADKALGGTTVMNGMRTQAKLELSLIVDIFYQGLYYIRGNKADYDAWEQLGNPGWYWDTLLPYFLRSEKFAVPTNAQREAGMSYETEYHGE